MSYYPFGNTIPKAPFVKPKGFLHYLLPHRNGFPDYADSVRNPEVIGTVEYEHFWEMELAKITQGFWIGKDGENKIWIPGRFYYYMNYKQMSTIRGVITPDYIDLHLELAYHIEYCLLWGKNLLCAKGRRKGISEAVSTMVVDYGWRFTEGFKAGVAAGNKTYVEDFVAKWRFADSRLPPEFSTKKLTDNDDEIIAGYSIKNQHNSYDEKGTFNTIYARTMHTNPNMFKGLYLNVVISEEVGEHENWIEFYGATKDCLMSGNKQVGIMVIFGTAGNINKGSKDFKKVWHDPETYNAVKFMIPADRFYFYGGAKNENQKIPQHSQLLTQYSDYQLIGYEDRELSLKNIMDRRALLLKQGNLKEYNEDLQNNPINETEMFRKTVVNNFDTNKLNEIMARIDNYSHPKYSKYKLEWVLDEKKLPKMPLEVKAIPIKDTDDQNECVWILDGEFPRKGHYFLYSCGLDSYDQDQAKASKSLGAMSVRIRNNNIPNARKNCPVAVICCRPRRKEIFYDMSFKLAVFYGLEGAVLCDVAAALVMQYFKDNGGWRYLADRPTKFESESSEQTHEKGIRLTNFSRPRMTALMQSDIIDNGDQYEFPELVNQLGNFDEVEIGSDNDLADAHGLSLIQDASTDVKARNSEMEDVPNRYELPEFESDGNGGMRKKIKSGNLTHIQQDSALFGMLFPGHNE